MPRVANSLGATPEAAVPTSYTVESVELENHRGRRVDVSGFVTDLTVSESIYRPTVSLRVNVRDDVSLLEELELCGQEWVNLTLSRRDLGSRETKRVSHRFAVTDYPLYSRVSYRLQVFSLVGVSPHAYLSQLKRVSRSLTGSPLELVRGLLVNDLGVSEKLIDLGSGRAALVSVVVPDMRPLDACQWLLRRTWDQTGSPYHLFEKFGGGIKVLSLREMTSQELNPVVREYREKGFFSKPQQTAGDFQERLSRIEGMASNLGLGKLAPASAGAFAAVTRSLDVFSKTYTEETFAAPTAPQLDPRVGPDGSRPGFQSLKWSRRYDVPVDASRPDSYHASSTGNGLAGAVSRMELGDTLTHDLTVPGDLSIGAGSRVSLKLSRPSDPSVKRVNSAVPAGDVDTIVSGDYLVAGVVHRFSDKYYMDVKLKRDSLGFDPSAP